MDNGVGIILNDSSMNLEFLTKWAGVENLIVWIVWFFVFLWIVWIIWVAKDISSRSESTTLQVVSIILVTLFTPLIWLPLYRVIRPVWYKKDNIPRREACATNLITCNKCNTLNPREYTCCIECWEYLTIECKQCKNKYPHSYHYCNTCWAPNIC
jgi:ABC-type nickel/cobalt efflux system permease component RcnA